MISTRIALALLFGVVPVLAAVSCLFGRMARGGRS